MSITFLLELLGYFTLLISSCFLIRWIFGIDKIIDRLDKQYKLQKAIGEMVGLDNEDLLKIDDIDEYHKYRLLTKYNPE